MKKVDLFQADRTMSGRVEEYVKCRVLRKAIMKDFGDQIKAIDTSIANLEKLKGSILENTIEESRANFLVARADLVAKRDKQIEAEAIFEFTKSDKDFKKALKGLSMDSPVIAEQVVAWFKNYNLAVADRE